MRNSSPFSIFLAAFAALAVCITVTAESVYAKPRPQSTYVTMSESIAACDKVARDSKNLINCVITDVRGHPTLAVEFVNEQSMKVHFAAFAKRVAEPFCKTANKGHAEAFFVVALKMPRMGSVSWCETGESSGWVSLTSL